MTQDLWERRYHVLAEHATKNERMYTLKVNTLAAQLERTLRVLDRVVLVLNNEIPVLEPVSMTTVRLKGIAQLADTTSSAIKGEKGEV